ncbi:hypothetical protein JW796_02985 [Candidatus Dojkabacteria bacterium]|nr:hypothetical protein [Candidatus Dojkabacteria bacterium]
MAETLPERKRCLFSRLFLIGTLMKYLGNILSEIGDFFGLVRKKKE